MTPNRLKSYWFYLHSNLTLYATHHHLVGRVGVEPTTPKERIYSPPRLPIRYLPIFIWLLTLELNKIKTTYEAAGDTYLPPAICCNFSSLYRSYSCHKDLWYATSNSNRNLMHFECISSASWDSGAYLEAVLFHA